MLYGACCSTVKAGASAGLSSPPSIVIPGNDPVPEPLPAPVPVPAPRPGPPLPPFPVPPAPRPLPVPFPPVPPPDVLPEPDPVPDDPLPEASFAFPEPPPTAALCPAPVPAFEATSVAALGDCDPTWPVAGVVEGVPLDFPGVSEFGFSVPPGAMANFPRASPLGTLALLPGGNGIGLSDTSGSSALPCISIRATCAGDGGATCLSDFSARFSVFTLIGLGDGFSTCLSSSSSFFG